MRDLRDVHLDAWAFYLREAGREGSGVEKVHPEGIRAPKPGAYSPASRAQALVALGSFLSWMDERHDLAPVPEKVIRRALKVERVQTQRHYNVLSDDEAARVFAAAGEGKDPERQADVVLVARDRALVAVMLDAGRRVASLPPLPPRPSRENSGRLWSPSTMPAASRRSRRICATAPASTTVGHGSGEVPLSRELPSRTT